MIAPPPPTDPLRAAITAAWARDEATHVTELLAAARRPDAERRAVHATAADLDRINGRRPGALRAVPMGETG